MIDLCNCCDIGLGKDLDKEVEAKSTSLKNEVGGMDVAWFGSLNETVANVTYLLVVIERQAAEKWDTIGIDKSWNDNKTRGVVICVKYWHRDFCLMNMGCESGWEQRSLDLSVLLRHCCLELNNFSVSRSIHPGVITAWHSSEIMTAWHGRDMHLFDLDQEVIWV